VPVSQRRPERVKRGRVRNVAARTVYFPDVSTADDLLMADEAIHDHCGIVGIFDPTNQLDIPRYLVIAMTALQHRGQESAGVALLLPGTGEIVPKTGMGRVRDVFPQGTDDLPKTCCGIGHVRYSTTGSSCVENAAPFVLRPGRKMIDDAVAIAHNGNVVNASELRAEITDIAFQSDTDSEVIAALLLRAGGESFAHRLRQAAHRLRGAYSLVLLAEGKLYGLRDPYGMRPLSLGRLGDGWILASETCAFDRVGATFVRELAPGELVTIDEQGCRSETFLRRARRGLCVFEFVYFSDATSVLDGRNVYQVREELGRQLAREYPAEADMVVPVPLTAIPMALGYAEQTGLAFAEPVIASRYADRSFIKPDQRLRRLEIDLKFNIVQSKIEGKRIVLVEDSIVRGNTLQILIKALRRKGASEVHMRVAAPPIKHPCYFGIDIPDEDELIASHRSVDAVARYIGADSLGYLSLAGLGRATGGGAGDTDHAAEGILRHRFCFGCMDERGYPFPVREDANRLPSDVR
jgi:amidophosphoribosyltransferase